MSEVNKAIIRRMFEGVNQHNLSMIEDLYPDCVYHSPVTGELRGEAFRQFVGSVLAAFPDGRWTVEDMLADGDRVVTRWTFTGTHRATLMGIAPTGKQVNITGVTIDRVVDGKVVEEREEWDSLGMMRQMGAVLYFEHVEAKVAA